MANGHGGVRAGAGRKSTKHEYIDDGLVTPLMFLLDIMRNEAGPMSDRVDAAKAALPYCSARLLSQSLDIEGDIDIRLISYLDDQG